MRTYYCLVVADSRGRKMHRLIRRKLSASGLPIKVNILHIPGANLHKIEERALSELRMYRYDLVLIMGGVNDLTRRTSRGLPLIPVYDSVDYLVSDMYSRFERIKNTLAPWGAKVVISLLIGIDLEMYNEYTRGPTTDYTHHQTIINEGMIHLNKAIASLNTDTHSLSPWILDTVHYYVRHKVIHKYTKLYDGLHPTPTLRYTWTKKILVSICKNLGFYFEW